MKKTLTDRKRKILRRIYGALSLTSALFIFQACYGTPNDFGFDTFIQGSVKSKKTNLPISGIKISVENQSLADYTNSNGEFKLFTVTSAQYVVRIEDVDKLVNGQYLTKDTLVAGCGESYHLNVLLDE
jgi:hypothetical protein